MDKNPSFKNDILTLGVGLSSDFLFFQHGGDAFCRAVVCGDDSCFGSSQNHYTCRKGVAHPTPEVSKEKNIPYNRIAAGFGDPANHLKCILYHGKPPINA